MRGYYLYPAFSEKEGTNSSGVMKKVNRHMKVLQKHFEMESMPLKILTTTKGKIVSRLPYGLVPRNYDEVLNSMRNPDFIYMRRINLDRGCYHFFREIKAKWPYCKLIVEIYTYPYDVDDFLRNFEYVVRMLPFYLKDKYYRVRQKQYVDRFVTYSNDDEIFGVKTIRTINGYDVAADTPKKPKQAETGPDFPIHMISVAHLQPQHGYERVIRGLAEYYASGDCTREVFYHVVGDGPEQEKYRKLAEEYHLEEHVIFYGKRVGEELTMLYNQCDLGLCSFGLYKYGIDACSALKIPEYLAKGLPIMTGCKTCMLGDEEIRYCLEFPNDPSSIDIHRMIQFYDSLYGNREPEQLITQIREYAMSHFSEDLAFEPIVRYIEAKQ